MENQNSAYSVVIADLKKQRDEITSMIDRLEAMSAGKPITTTPVQRSHDSHDDAPSFEMDDNPYLGMSIVDSAKDLLTRSRKPLGNAAILAGIENGGIVLSGENKLNTIGSVLNRRQRERGDIVSVKRGTWGLKEWYPGRNFGKKPPDEKNGATKESDRESGASGPYGPNVTPIDRSNGYGGS